jgi:hypothetical protein
LYEKYDETDFKHKASFFQITFIRDIISEVLLVVKSVHFLPASRSGLYQALSAFGQIIAELSRSRSLLSKKIELPGISEPLSDYFIKLSEIRRLKRQSEETELSRVALKIEEEILDGHVYFADNTKKIMYSHHGTGLKLALSATSSMVSELSPVVSYLRYVLPADSSSRRGQRSSLREISGAKSLVIIEEPEAHLHPEIQIKLSKIFAELINADVKLIVTSHSNYIFAEFNNLILSRSVKVGSMSASVFKKTEFGASANEIKVDEFGMDDENFIDTSERLMSERQEIIERINNDV